MSGIPRAEKKCSPSSFQTSPRLGNGRAAVGRLGESDAQCGFGLRDIGKESRLALLRLRRHLGLTCSQQLVSKQSERRRHQERPPRASHGPRPGLGRDVRHMGAARSRRFRVRPPCRQRRRRASGLVQLFSLTAQVRFEVDSERRAPQAGGGRHAVSLGGKRRRPVLPTFTFDSKYGSTHPVPASAACENARTTACFGHDRDHARAHCASVCSLSTSCGKSAPTDSLMSS